MQIRPFPAHPTLEQYEQQARDLRKACSDPQSLHAWVEQWVASYLDDEAETQARLRDVVLTASLRELSRREEIARMLAGETITPAARAASPLSRSILLYTISCGTSCAPISSSTLSTSSICRSNAGWPVSTTCKSTSASAVSSSVAEKADDLMIVVAGGVGRKAAYAPTWGGTTKAISREIKIRK